MSAILKGTIRNPDLSPARGKVRIKPGFTHSLNIATNVLVAADTKVITLQSGTFSVELQATDDPAYDPINFTYSIRFDLIGHDIDTFSFYLPNGTTVDIADVAPVPSRAGDLTGKVYIQSTEPTSPLPGSIWIQI